MAFRIHSISVLAFILSLLATSASAITYNVNLALSDNFYIFYTGHAPGTITVNGQITTDGTIGLLSASNIVSWDFILDTGSVALSMSSAPTNGYKAYSNGWSSFFATGSQLSVDNGGQRGWNIGNVKTETTVPSYLYSVFLSGGQTGLFAEVSISNDYDPLDRIGSLAEDHSYSQGGVIGTASVTVVPLPQGAGLLIAGLCGLGLFSRRKPLVSR